MTDHEGKKESCLTPYSELNSNWIPILNTKNKMTRVPRGGGGNHLYSCRGVEKHPALLSILPTPNILPVIMVTTPVRLTKLQTKMRKQEEGTTRTLNLSCPKISPDLEISGPFCPGSTHFSSVQHQLQILSLKYFQPRP